MKVLKYLVIALVMATSFSYAETASAKTTISVVSPVQRRTVVIRRGPRRTVITRRVYRRSYHRPHYRHYRHY